MVPGTSGEQQDDTPYYPVVPGTTRELDTTSLGNLSGISGDTIIVGKTDLSPAGLLRKVTEKTIIGSTVELETEQGRLKEAVKEGYLGCTTSLASDHLIASSSKHIQVVPNSRTIKTRALNIELDNVEGIPGIYVNGEVSFDIDILFEKGLLTFIPIVMPAEINLYFTPVLALNVGLDGTVSTDMNAVVRQVAELQTGTSYSGGWEPFKDFTATFDFQIPSVQDACSVKAYLVPQLELLLYSIVGATANTYGCLELEAAMVEADTPIFATTNTTTV